jgi:hypothetical protein
MLQRCMGMGPREENNDKCTHNQRPNGGNDLPQEASVIKSNVWILKDRRKSSFA